MFQLIFVKPLFNLLFLIYSVVPSLGGAIILLTILIKLVLWPIDTKAIHSRKKLQELQPEMQKLKEKYKGNQQELGKATMELYKEKKVNPFSSCIVGIIQAPFLIALFYVIQNSLKGEETFASFFYGGLKNLPIIQQLIASPQALDTGFFGIDLIRPSIVLAVLAGAAVFWQTKMTLPAQKDPSQKMASQLVYIMPLMVGFFATRFPAALSLFWVSSTLIAVLQQYIVFRADINFLERIKNHRWLKKKT